MRFLVVLLFLAVALGDKFVPCQPGDKGPDDSYVVLFHAGQAPDTTSPEIVQAWADKILGGGVVTHAYSIHEFRGFSAILSARQLGLLLNLPEVQEVAENCIYRIPETNMKTVSSNTTALLVPQFQAALAGDSLAQIKTLKATTATGLSTQDTLVLTLTFGCWTLAADALINS
jgi:hypothetical protein